MEEYIYIKIPADAWDTLYETLSLDAVSSSFDKELRAEIKEALEKIEYVNRKSE